MATSQNARGRARRPEQVPITSGRGLRVILSTAPARSAPRLARALVETRVAACVNIVPGIRSVYRWKGRVESARESLLVIKTTAARAPACLAALTSLHPYDVPEALLFTPGSALTPYASWLDALGGLAKS